MITTSMVIGGLVGLFFSLAIYTVIGLLKTKKQVAVHNVLIEAVAREHTSEHEKIHYKMEASDDLLRTEILLMIQEMHVKLDKTIDILQNNMNTLDASQSKRIDYTCDIITNRLNELETRLPKKPSREPKSKKQLEQIEQINS